MGDCTSCNPNFILLQGICIFKDLNCIQANYDLGICQICTVGYLLSVDNLTCVLISACIQSNPVCTQCVSTYQLVNSTCYVLPVNCQQMDQNLICNVCSSKTILVKTQPSCVYYIDYCQSYDNLGQCTNCLSGYYFEYRTCVIYPANCSAVDPNTFICVSCVTNYTLSRGAICINNIIYCQTYNNSGCENCISNYYLNNNTCISYPSYCGAVDLNGNCIFCQLSLTTLLNGKCVFYQLFCLAYNSNGNCTTVPRDFTLNNQGLVNNKLTISWDSRGNFVTCATSIRLIQGNCVLPISFCTQYDQMANCRICTSGYNLNLLNCVNSITICTNFRNGVCLTCANQYVLINGSCYNINNFAVTTGLVTSISIGY
jgi:hypothetical protein